MRIAIFHNLPSGGAKRALFEWTRRLANDHIIDAFSLETADHIFCDIRPLVSQHKVYKFAPRELFRSPFGRLNQLQRWRDLGDLQQLSRNIAREIDLGGYDVLLANTCTYTFIPALLQYVKVPSAYYLHEPFGSHFVRQFMRPYLSNGSWRETADQLDPLRWSYKNRLVSIQRRSIHRTTMLLANSSFTGAQIENEFGIRTVFSPCGVDIRDFRPMHDAERENYVVSVGELSPRKGFDFIVESLGKIPADQRPSLKLACNMIIGDELAYVRKLAQTNGVHMVLLEKLGVRELRDLYSRAKLCVYAPVMEPFGLVPLEAMACGTPVVGVREGGVQESVVHEQTGLLVERDAGKFATAIKEMIGNPDLAATYGRNAREHVVQNWTWDRSVSMLSSHLADCVRLHS